MQGLADLLRQARELAATLTASYQEYHDRELKELANALAIEHRQISADLNTRIEQTRIMIVDQIMAGEAVFDAVTSTVRISWGNGAFDANVPLPYPEVAPKEKHQ
jgi:F0F1-type ATP synthase membrane subunit b/b'